MGSKKEILPTLNRRMVLPLYIPVLALLCSLLLIRSKKNYLNRFVIFIYSFSLLVFTELTVRYTGINEVVKYLFIITPIILFILFYIFLNYKFSKESKSL